MPENVRDQAVLLLHGRLDVSRLLTRRFRPGCTVVLSACSVGSHVRDAPLEALGFPATLLSTGVRSLIGSLWPVADSAAMVNFMTQLHQRSQNGESPSRALGATVAACAQQGIRSTVWGGFATFGA